MNPTPIANYKLQLVLTYQLRGIRCSICTVVTLLGTGWLGGSQLLGKAHLVIHAPFFQSVAASSELHLETFDYFQVVLLLDVACGDLNPLGVC